MRLRIARASFSCLVVAITCSVAVQAQGPYYVGNSPREFVEGFYKWYVPLALNYEINRSWDAALKLAHPPFSRQLTKLLREDAAAQDRCKELVGLDFDPFLNSQDPAQRYIIGTITRAGQDYRAEVYRVDHGVRGKEPNLIAEFKWDRGRWFFVNFYYLSPEGDLLTTLKSRPTCSEPRIPNGR